MKTIKEPTFEYIRDKNDPDDDFNYKSALDQYERELGRYYEEINKPMPIEEYLQNNGHESILEEYKKFISS
jgi:hypothetical protein